MAAIQSVARASMRDRGSGAWLNFLLMDPSAESNLTLRSRVEPRIVSSGSRREAWTHSNSCPVPRQVSSSELATHSRPTGV